MRLARVRRTLQVLCGGLWLAGLGVVVWATTGGGQESVTSAEATDPTPANAAVTTLSPLPSLAQFGQVWRKPLRQPLFDPPVETKVAATTSVVRSAPIPVKLVGTAVEGKRSVAWLFVAPMTMEVRAVGETLGDPPNQIQVVDIRPDRVSLRHGGGIFDVQLDKKEH